MGPLTILRVRSEDGVDGTHENGIAAKTSLPNSRIPPTAFSAPAGAEKAPLH